MSWETKWSLRAPEPFEEPAGVALALCGDGVQEGGFYHAGLHAGLCQALYALVEEGSRQGTRFARDGDDHTVEVRRATIADGTDGVDGVRAVLADGEDMQGGPSAWEPGSPLGSPRCAVVFVNPACSAALESPDQTSPATLLASGLS